MAPNPSSPNEPSVPSAAQSLRDGNAAAMSTRSAIRDRMPRLATLLPSWVRDSLPHTHTPARRLPIRASGLQQKLPEINYPGVALAATVESFYRSALNAVLNRQLSGDARIPLFPAMHVQTPMRVAYITGFKALRLFLDKHIRPDDVRSANARAALFLALAIAPGIVMTPIASVLEACNVAAVNNEPLLRRAVRGLVPRCGREIIFGVGLNQLSDFFDHRYRTAMNWGPGLATTAGSVTAGVCAGYLSHVPHNLSTLRLLHPQRSYAQLFQMLVDKSAPPAAAAAAAAAPSVTHNIRRVMWTLLMPKGLFTRTVQICGSFAILNGIIHFMDGDARRRTRKRTEVAVDAHASDPGHAAKPRSK